MIGMEGQVSPVGMKELAARRREEHDLCGRRSREPDREIGGWDTQSNCFMREEGDYRPRSEQGKVGKTGREKGDELGA